MSDRQKSMLNTFGPWILAGLGFAVTHGMMQKDTETMSKELSALRADYKALTEQVNKIAIIQAEMKVDIKHFINRGRREYASE